MSTITARIPDDLNLALTKVAKLTERSKNHIIYKAIQNYVAEIQEDIEDYNEAIEALKDNSPPIPFEEVIRKLGIEDRIGLRNE